ncbi:MAG: sulfotransferase family protein [Magnetospiraceae bacterium]
MTARRQGVVVLGMHRSGTSVLTRAIDLLGFDLGNDVLPPQPDNPKGFFENKDVVMFNQRVLARLGVRWDSLIFSGPSAAELDRLPGLVDRGWDIYQANFAAADKWVLKDPRLCVMMPLWQRVFARDPDLDLRYIVAIRHPVEVVDSLIRRGKAVPNLYAYTQNPDAGYLFWLLFMTRALEAVGDNGALVSDFADLVRDPRGELRRVAGYLEAGNAETAAAADVFAADFLDPALRQTKPPADLESLRQSHPMVVDLYAALQGVAAGTQSWAAAREVAQAMALPLQYLDTVRRTEYGRLLQQIQKLRQALESRKKPDP